MLMLDASIGGCARCHGGGRRVPPSHDSLRYLVSPARFLTVPPVSRCPTRSPRSARTPSANGHADGGQSTDTKTGRAAADADSSTDAFLRDLDEDAAVDKAKTDRKKAAEKRKRDEQHKKASKGKGSSDSAKDTGADSDDEDYAAQMVKAAKKRQHKKALGLK